MKKIIMGVMLTAAMVFAGELNAATITWDGSSINGTLSSPADISSGGALALYGSTITNAGSIIYTNSTNNIGGSGGNNYGAAVSPAGTNVGFSFSLTLSDPTAQLQLDSLSFYSRSTATGPTAITLQVSNDNLNFVTIGSYAANTDGVWAAFSGLDQSFTSTGNTLYFKIDGLRTSGNTSSSANWRLDDIVLGYTVIATIPEPSTYALMGLGAGILVLA
ncbi:MAG: PEP-CTERM sorting domain-containing protein [Verrucomicrobiales bacterium]|jgi:hypothetical protein|nr:PEP-CTERM sorting domain-containing protein [Verrucomicrobiales bacterium]